MENEKNLDAIEDELADIASGLRRLTNSDDSFDVFVISRGKDHTQSTEAMKTAKTTGETAAVTSQVGAITSSSWNELWTAIESNKGTTPSMPVDKMPAIKQVAADSPVPVVPSTAAETPTADDSICARKKLVAKRRLIRQKDGQMFREDNKTVAVAPVAPVIPEAPATPTMLVRPVAPVVPRDVISARKRSVAKRRLRSGRNNSSSQGDQANREAMPFSVTTPSSAPLYDAGTLTALMAWKKVVSKRRRRNNRGTGMCEAGETDNEDFQEEERENSKDQANSSKGDSNENEREDKSKTKEHNGSREEDESGKDEGASSKPDGENNKDEGESSKDEGKDSNKGEVSSKADEESSKDKGASGETGEENDQDRGDTSNDKGDTESDSDGKKIIEDRSESSKDKGESSKDEGESSKTEDSSKTEENSGKDEGASDNPNKENDREKEDNSNNESSNDREESGTDEKENSEDEGDIDKDEEATDRTDEGKSKDEKDDNDDDNSIKDDGGSSKDGGEGDKDELTISEDGEGSGKDEEEESEDDEVELNFGKHYDWCDFVNSLDSLDFISFLARGSRCAILDIIATMLQNYEWAQNKVRSKDWLFTFISTLKNDSDDRVRIKALYAISCAVRDHADNRRDFLDNHDGLLVLFRAIQTDVPKLQIKSIFLLKSIVTSEPSACETFHSRGHGIVELLVSIAFCQNRVNYAADDDGENDDVDTSGDSDNNGANNDDSSTSDSDSLVDHCFSTLWTLATFNSECLFQIRRFVSPLRSTQERRLERIQREESRVADDETDAEELFRLIDEGGDNVDVISLRHCQDETDAKELFRLVEGENDEGDDVDAISLYH